jgi:hypothetical protein
MKKLRILPIVALLLALGVRPAAAQHGGHMAHGTVSVDEAAIAAVVDQLFDGMRAGDSAMVRSVFHPEIRMVTSFRNREGQPQVAVEESLDGFVQAVGTPHEEVWDEKIWGLVILTDGDFGMAWMNYGFFMGEQFSHCGVDLMELVRTGEGWKIIALADTRRREGCEVPEGL